MERSQDEGDGMSVKTSKKTLLLTSQPAGGRREMFFGKSRCKKYITVIQAGADSFMGDFLRLYGWESIIFILDRILYHMLDLSQKFLQGFWQRALCWWIMTLKNVRDMFGCEGLKRSISDLEFSMTILGNFCNKLH